MSALPSPPRPAASAVLLGLAIDRVEAELELSRTAMAFMPFGGEEEEGASYGEGYADGLERALALLRETQELAP